MNPSFDTKYNFESSQWTSGGFDITFDRWWNSTSPENVSNRNFPILNDRLFWRLVETDPDQQWFYGEKYEPSKDIYRFFIYSSADLYKKGFEIVDCLILRRANEAIKKV